MASQQDVLPAVCPYFSYFRSAPSLYFMKGMREACTNRRAQSIEGVGEAHDIQKAGRLGRQGLKVYLIKTSVSYNQICKSDNARVFRETTQ